MVICYILGMLTEERFNAKEATSHHMIVEH